MLKIGKFSLDSKSSIVWRTTSTNFWKQERFSSETLAPIQPPLKIEIQIQSQHHLQEIPNLIYSHQLMFKEIIC